MADKGSGGNRGHQPMANDGFKPAPAQQNVNKGYQPQPGTGKVQGGYQAPSGGGKPSAPTTGSGVSGGGGGKK